MIITLILIVIEIRRERVAMRWPESQPGRSTRVSARVAAPHEVYDNRLCLTRYDTTTNDNNAYNTTTNNNNDN